MRNTPFRARDLKTGSLSYFGFSSCLPIYGNPDEFKVEYNTTLLDSNGTPIYENDLIKIDLYSSSGEFVRTISDGTRVKKYGWEFGPGGICSYFQLNCNYIPDKPRVFVVNE